MNVIQALRTMLSNAGISAYRVSLDLGFRANYLQAILSRGTNVRSDVLQKVADVCGYKLALIKDDDVIIIDE